MAVEPLGAKMHKVAITGGFIRGLLLASVLLMAIVSCAGTGTKGRAEQIKESFYTSLRFDSRGMPEFSEEVSKRPDNRGDDFFLVEADNAGRALMYYHITVKGGKADMKRPFRTLLDRTAAGIKGGTAFAMNILMTPGTSSDNNNGEAVLAFAAVSVAVGTAGGITVGLVEGTYDGVVEIGRALSSQEEMLSFSALDYDRIGRLRTLRAFEPGLQGERARELFRIKYSYEDGYRVPSRITVEDLPDNRPHILYNP